MIDPEQLREIEAFGCSLLALFALGFYTLGGVCMWLARGAQ